MNALDRIMYKKSVEEGAKKKRKARSIEPGVRVIEPPTDPKGNKHGDVYMYDFNVMDEKAIAKYGLTSTFERWKANKEGE